MSNPTHGQSSPEESYIKQTERNPRGEIDLARFAADLAKALGGELQAAGDYPNEVQTFRVGADLVCLHANNWKRRVNVSISAPDVPHDERFARYDKSDRPESATVSPDRPIATIARDVKRRVIDASQPALTLQRENAKANATRRAAIVVEADALKATCPMLDVKVNEREQRATIWGSGDHYLSATLSADGKVHVERIGSMDRATFQKIVALLGPKESQ